MSLSLGDNEKKMKKHNRLNNLMEKEVHKFKVSV